MNINPLLYHRAVLVLDGKDLTENISDSDPGNNNVPLQIQPLDVSKETKQTAELLNQILTNANKTLKNHPSNELRRKNGIPITRVTNQLKLISKAGNYKIMKTFLFFLKIKREVT